MARSGIAILREGREKSVLNRHPWIFSGSLDQKRTHLEDAEPGEIVEVRDYRGGFLARGYYNPHSQIRIRLLSWDQTEALGAGWWRIQLAKAIARRAEYEQRPDTDAYRLVNAENDGLPGLVVDRYGDFLVVQFLTLGVDVLRETLVGALDGLVKPTGIFERSDVDVREKEGLPEVTGQLWGDAPPEPLIISEHGVKHPVDVYSGHKTGFYLDQKDSRRWLLTHPEIAGKEVLNAFSFTGGFGACALLNGAGGVVNLDSSQPALDAARETLRINALDADQCEFIGADVFEQLRIYRDDERLFDMVILDPPKFAHAAAQVEAASRGYKDINWLAFQLLRPGGILMTFSCSGHVEPDLFQKIVFGASADAERSAQIIGWLAQPSDHPVMLAFPEGRYLKGLVCRVT